MDVKLAGTADRVISISNSSSSIGEALPLATAFIRVFKYGSDTARAASLQSVGSSSGLSLSSLSRRVVLSQVWVTVEDVGLAVGYSSFTSHRNFSDDIEHTEDSSTLPIMVAEGCVGAIIGPWYPNIGG